MKNYMKSLRARKGVTAVAAATLVTLTLGCATHALADEIEVLNEERIEVAAVADEGIETSGGTASQVRTKDSVREDFANRVRERAEAMREDVDQQGQPEDDYIDISDASFEDKQGFELGDGWYIVKSSRDFANRLNITGDVKLILCDDVTANFTEGICCQNGKLTIYAQSTEGNMGTLVATGSGENAGIGSDNEQANNGEINIYGGNVTATGKDGAASIGRGESAKDGKLTVSDALKISGKKKPNAALETPQDGKLLEFLRDHEIATIRQGK